MSNAAQAFLGHPAHESLKQLDAAIRQSINVASQQGVDSQRDEVERLKLMVSYVRSVLKAVDPVLAPRHHLNAIQQQADRTAAELNNYCGNHNPAHLSNASTHCDSLIAQVRQFPVPTVAREAQALGETLRKSQRSVIGTLGSLKKQVQEAEGKLRQIEAMAEQVASDVASQKSRIDTVVSQQQEQFSNAQEERRKEAAAALQEQRVEFDALVATVEQKAKDLEADQIDRVDQYMAGLEQRAQEFIAKLEDYQNQAEKLLDAVGRTGQTAAYGQAADQQRKAVWVWQGITLVSLGVFLLVGIKYLLPSLSGGADWGVVVGRTMLGLALAGLVSWTARQAAVHHRREEQYRSMQLQLAAIDPYLALLPDDEKVAVKKDLARRLFDRPGAPPRPVSQGEEMLPERLRALLGNGQGAGNT